MNEQSSYQQLPLFYQDENGGPIFPLTQGANGILCLDGTTPVLTDEDVKKLLHQNGYFK